MGPDDEVLGQFLGDDDFPVQWESEQESALFWVYDDLHCPQPLSPMYFDIGGRWLSCDHMFRRFGTPFAVDWLAKNVNGYLDTAAIPADAALTDDVLFLRYNELRAIIGDSGDELGDRLVGATRRQQRADAYKMRPRDWIGTATRSQLAFPYLVNVLAREFTIPAVVGTSVATQRINTGDRIRVDGGAGTVGILQRAAEDPGAHVCGLPLA